MRRRRSSAAPVRLVLTLWAAFALWLVPAAKEQRVAGGGVRAIPMHDVTVLDAARLPERLETTVRAGLLAPVGRGHGAASPIVPPVATTPGPFVARRRVHALPTTARRVVVPRRLAFPVEATAPPATLS